MKATKAPTVKGGGDLVLQEIWRIKDELSAARGHDVHRLFADARKRQKRSGHPDRESSSQTPQGVMNIKPLLVLLYPRSFAPATP